MAKFLVHSGEIISPNDGDVHFIPSHQVIKLYGLKPHDCITDDRHFSGIALELYPDSSGKYNLPDEIQRQRDKEVEETLKKFINITNNMTFWERLKFLIKGKYDWV